MCVCILYFALFVRAHNGGLLTQGNETGTYSVGFAIRSSWTGSKLLDRNGMCRGALFNRPLLPSLSPTRFNFGCFHDCCSSRPIIRWASSCVSKSMGQREPNSRSSCSQPIGRYDAGKFLLTKI